ncbi:hypothetical protein [Methanocaldococcus lauensis]|nr:hypothetical protein [Methanocaldococcus lauensis]
MIGVLVAEPVALGDIGAAAYIYGDATGNTFVKKFGEYSTKIGNVYAVGAAALGEATYIYTIGTIAAIGISGPALAGAAVAVLA